MSITKGDTLATLAALPELAHYHKSAEKYQEDDNGWKRPEYARVIASGTFTLTHRFQWGGGTERPLSVTGIAVINGGGHGYTVHDTDCNRALFPQSVGRVNQWHCVTIITKDTLRGWRDAGPYRTADKVRDERAKARETYRIERAATEQDVFARAEQVAATLTASLGVRVTASRSSYGPPCLTLSLPNAERLAAHDHAEPLPTTPTED